MADDNSEGKNTERQKLIAVVMTLFALAFIAGQIADVIDAFELNKSPQFILRAVAIVAAVAAIVWGWLRFREKTKTKR
jgi:hypothetical protein